MWCLHNLTKLMLNHSLSYLFPSGFFYTTMFNIYLCLVYVIYELNLADSPTFSKRSTQPARIERQEELRFS